MNDRDDKPTEAMESLLRRWGADQAAREALVPPAPVATRPKRSRLAATVYWLSTAAAAGILPGDVVTHVFYNEDRDHYQLENLWFDAPRVTFKGINS